SVAIVLLAAEEQTVLGIALPVVRILGIGREMSDPCFARFVMPTQANEHLAQARSNFLLTRIEGQGPLKFDEGFVIPGQDGKAVAESEVEPPGLGRAAQGLSEERDGLLRLAVIRQLEAVVALGDERRRVEPHGRLVGPDGLGSLSGVP